MRVLALPILLLLIATQSNCGHKITYPELNNVSEIEVMEQSNPIKKTSDPLLISKVVEFINKRRADWEPPFLHGFPSTKVSLHLYRDGQFIGSFGITKSSFSMQRHGRWDSKPATTQEVQEVVSLLGIDKALLEQGPGRTTDKGPK
jgi:hypothetical protein